MHDSRVNLGNYFKNSDEARWIRFQYEQGISVDDIVVNVEKKMGGLGTDTKTVVEYILEKKGFEDIQHMITPHMPNRLEFVTADNEGYLYQARGETPEAMFKVLLKIPRVSKPRVDAMVSKHLDELCFLAYKRAHEGHPVAYGSGVARAGIGSDSLLGLLDD